MHTKKTISKDSDIYFIENIHSEVLSNLWYMFQKVHVIPIKSTVTVLRHIDILEALIKSVLVAVFNKLIVQHTFYGSVCNRFGV